MKIALDYDDTYTRDPQLWDTFIAIAERRGHEVVCVTMRHEREAIEMPCPVIYTGRKAKEKFIADGNHGYVDIWIDDSPHWVHQDAL